VVVRTCDPLAKSSKKNIAMSYQDASLRDVLGDRQGDLGVGLRRLRHDGRLGSGRGADGGVGSRIGGDGPDDGRGGGAGLTLRSGGLGHGRVVVQGDGRRNVVVDGRRNVVVDGGSLRIGRVNGGSREVLGHGRRGRELDGLGDDGRLLGTVTQGVGDGDVVGGRTGVGDSADDRDARDTGTSSHGSGNGVVHSIGALDPAGTREVLAARGNGDDEGGNDAEQLEGHHFSACWFNGKDCNGFRGLNSKERLRPEEIRNRTIAGC
jgi:hypothetical protein